MVLTWRRGLGDQGARRGPIHQTTSPPRWARAWTGTGDPLQLVTGHITTPPRRLPRPELKWAGKGSAAACRSCSACRASGSFLRIKWLGPGTSWAWNQRFTAAGLAEADPVRFLAMVCGHLTRRPRGFAQLQGLRRRLGLGGAGRVASALIGALPRIQQLASMSCSRASRSSA